MASHPWPDVNVGTRKDPLPGASTVGDSNKHQLVNLYYYALGPDGVLKDTRFILVRAKCPYVQFAVVARVISTKRFIVGGTNSRERKRSQVSDGMVERTPRARLLLGCMRGVCCRIVPIDLFCELILPFSGVLCPPFYRPRESRGYMLEKGEKTEAKEPLRRCRVLLFY